MMLENTKKYIKIIASTLVKNILCFLYFSNQGSLGSMGGRTLRDVEKAPKKKIAFETTRGVKEIS